MKYFNLFTELLSRVGCWWLTIMEEWDGFNVNTWILTFGLSYSTRTSFVQFTKSGFNLFYIFTFLQRLSELSAERLSWNVLTRRPIYVSCMHVSCYSKTIWTLRDGHGTEFELLSKTFLHLFNAFDFFFFSTSCSRFVWNILISFRLLFNQKFHGVHV